jgi:hypothetical protein
MTTFDKLAEVTTLLLPSLQRMVEYNQNHDDKGRFTSGGDSGSSDEKDEGDKRTTAIKVTDRTMGSRDRLNPDAFAAVPDSQIHTAPATSQFNIHTGKWESYDPETKTYK